MALDGVDAVITRPVDDARTADLRTALALTWATIGWMTIEGVAALLLGYDSNSLLLETFGIDSILELVSAFVLLWRLRVELRGHANEEHIEAVERQASRIVGYTLYFLVALVLFTSFFKLFVSPATTDTHESVWGIGIGLVAKVGMPLLAAWKLKLAARLNSRALRADAMEAITCGYLSVVLMVGLGATWLLGWWWLDSIASLALIPFLIKEGREAIKGECCCHCE
jgi:divalent metal cation (Fe/Co/Zn/Cd) transporter